MNHDRVTATMPPADGPSPHREPYIGSWRTALVVSACACIFAPGLTPAETTTDLRHQLSAICTITATAPGGQVSSGTGFFISDKGHLLTNAHVVPVEVSRGIAKCEGGTVTISEKDVQRAPDEDLAVISTNLEGTPFLHLAYTAPADSVGDAIKVLGSPFELDGGLTAGLVSRVASLGDTLALQLSVAVTPGNSGSPVIGPRGTVVGIVSSLLQQSQATGFAIPSFLLWHYSQFAPAMQVSQKRLALDAVAPDLRRQYLVPNMKSDIVLRVRRTLDYCLDNEGMPPTEGRDVCATIRSQVRKNAKFLVVAINEKFGMTGAWILFRDRPETVFTAWMRRFADDNLQVVLWDAADSREMGNMRVLLTTWGKDPLAWF